MSDAPLKIPMQLKKPIVFMDIEATGIDTERDRIVEICLVKVSPDGKKEVMLERVNPGMPMPPEVVAIHGITDRDVQDKPFFRALAPRILEFIGDADLCGYNISRFDAPMLSIEMERSGVSLNLPNRSILDVMKIYHRKEPRDLASAYRFYCGKEIQNAHSALADTEATAEVFIAQLQRYEDIPKDALALHDFCSVKDPRFVDSVGHRFYWRYNMAHFNFGKYKGKSLDQVAGEDRNYLVWLVEEGKLPDDTWALCREALEGKFPRNS